MKSSWKIDAEKIIASNGGIRLDIGCGTEKQQGFVGMDRRDIPGVDLVHDAEDFPYPLPDECCLGILCSHIIEHIKPWLTIQFMDELWRIMKPGGQLAVTTPYAGSLRYWMDPTHCNGCNEATFQYFCPSSHLYEIYSPMPWEMERGFPVWKMDGNMEVLMRKLPQEAK